MFTPASASNSKPPHLDSVGVQPFGRCTSRHFALSLLLGLLLLSLGRGAPVNPLQGIHTARESGDYEGALDLLNRFETSQPELFALNNLDYLKARLLIDSGRIETGIALLAALDWRESLLGDSILVALLERAPDPLSPARRPHLLAFLENYPGHPSWPRWALAYADALKEHNQVLEAVEWYDRVWRAGVGSPSRRAALEHARSHLPRNHPAEAIRDLQNLIKKSTKDDVALQAVLDLHDLLPLAESSESGIRQRVNILVSNRRTKMARDYLDYLLGKFPRSLSAPQYRYLVARSYVFDGQLEKAYEGYRECYAEFPSADRGIFCKYQAGNTALRKLSYPTAIQEYREFLSAHPTHRRANRTYYNLADSYRWWGKDGEAEKTALRALEKFKGAAGRQFHYYLTRLYVEQKRFAEALHQLSYLDKLSSRSLPSGVTREEIQYFKGISLIQTERKETAQDAFRSGSEGRPNYFGYLCRDRLGERVGGDSSETEWEPRLVSPRPFYTNRAEIPSPTSRSLARIRELLFLGLIDEAAREIRRAGAGAFSDTNVYLFNLAHFSDKGGLPRESLEAAERLLNSRFRGTWPDQLPLSVQRLVYPRHYWPLIEEAARTYNVDPYLLLAIIYQESRFDPNAKSVASARGLMQFLMAPARRLARELVIPVPEEDDLYAPDLSIRLGAYHMKKLLRRHGDSVAEALAGYNGGSSNAKRWTAKGNQSTAEQFIANIGFRETKLYVLKVLGNYMTYKTLYESSDVETGEP